MSINRMTPEDVEKARTRLLLVMTRHAGPNKKIGMGELYEQVFDRQYHHRINDTRQLRYIITNLRNDGVPIVSNSSATNGGYWLAASASEITLYCAKGQRQAIGMLARIAKMKDVSLPEYLGQMRLELESNDA